MQDKKRKYTAEPYTEHILNVASLVGTFSNEGLSIEVAMCHDLFEDTLCTQNELSEILLGICYPPIEISEIIHGVVALTDVYTKESFPTINRSERKLREAERLGRIDPWIQSIKYADMVDNTFKHYTV